MKSIKAPLKGTWPREEFIRSRNICNEINEQKLDHPEMIRCSFCIKEITTPVINVVEFGLKVACHSCFTARYRNRRQIYRHIPVHPAIEKTADKYDEEAFIKAKVIQDQNVTQIRKASAKLDGSHEPKAD